MGGEGRGEERGGDKGLLEKREKEIKYKTDNGLTEKRKEEMKKKKD